MGLLDKYTAAPNGTTVAPPQVAALVRSNPAALLEGLDGTEPGNTYSYFKPGEYEVEVEKLCFVDKRDNTSMFACETKVVTSTNPDCPAGSNQSWTQKLQGVEPDQVKKNLMGLLLAIMDPSAEERAVIVNNARAILIDATGGPDKSGPQVLKGRRFHVSCFPYTIKKGPNQGKTTNVCNFRPATKVAT